MSAAGSDRRGVSELAGRSTVKKPGSSPGFSSLPDVLDVESVWRREQVNEVGCLLTMST